MNILIPPERYWFRRVVCANPAEYCDSSYSSFSTPSCPPYVLLWVYVTAHGILYLSNNSPSLPGHDLCEPRSRILGRRLLREPEIRLVSCFILRWSRRGSYTSLTLLVYMMLNRAYDSRWSSSGCGLAAAATRSRLHSRYATHIQRIHKLN